MRNEGKDGRQLTEFHRAQYFRHLWSRYVSYRKLADEGR